MFSKELFCNRLKTLRLEKKLTLEQLGLLFNVTKQTTSRWETGDRIPSIEIICMLAEFFEVTLDYMSGKTDNPNSIIDNKKNYDKHNPTTEEAELLEDFRLLDKYEQNIIMGKISEMIYNKSVEENNFEAENSEELINIELRDRLNK